MSQNSNKEVIEQLEKLHALLEEALECDEYVKSGCGQEYGDKIKKVIMTVDDLKGTPAVFKNFPVFPIDNDELPVLKQEYEKRKKIWTYILVATVILVLIFFLGIGRIFNALASMGVIATIIYYFVYSQGKKMYFEKQKAYNASIQKSEKSFADFRKALSVYEKEKEIGIANAEKFYLEYKSAYEKYEALLDEYENSKRNAMETLVNNMKEAKEIDFVPEEYYDFVEPMIAMLKSGRAENYKEALNMAIEEDRIMRAEAERREQEAKRIKMMEEQAAAEQRRAEELERHNRQMELDQQYQNKIMMEQQRKQADDFAKQQREVAWQAKVSADQAQREANKQVSAARSAGVAKCANCMNNRRCPTHVKESGGGLNCGSYTPYGSR